MAISQYVRTNVSGEITLTDGAATQLTLAFDRGDLSISGLKEVLNENVRIQRRGKFVNTAHGARIFPTVSFSSWVSAFQDSGMAPGDLITWIQRASGSAYASLESTYGSASGLPFAFDVTYTLEGTDFGDSADSTFTLHDCEVDSFDFAEAAEGLSITVNLTVTGEIDGDLDMDEVA